MYRFLLQAVGSCACSQPSYTEPMWGSGSPSELSEGGNFFLGVLAVLNQYESKTWCDLTWIVQTIPAALRPGVGSAHLLMLLTLGGEVCSAALAGPWTYKAPFCKCLWHGGWLFLCLFPSLVLSAAQVWPSVPKFCIHWCWGAIPVDPLPKQGAFWWHYNLWF